MYTVFLAGGSLIGGLIGSYIANAPEGWRYTFWIPGIISAGLLVLAFVLLPETLFDRPATSQDVDSSSEVKSDSKVISETTENVEEHEIDSGVPYHNRPTISFAQSLSFPKPKGGFAEKFLSPFLALRFPGTTMVMLHYAGLVGLIVSISTVAPTLLAAPPYLWGANVGLINVGGLIGTLLGAIYTYLLTDWFTQWSSKRQIHGFAEPEERLPLMIPALVLATAGSLVFGFVGQSPLPNGWVGLSFGYVSHSPWTLFLILRIRREWCPLGSCRFRVSDSII